MTIDIEDQLTTGMHEYVNGTQLSPDVLREATRRHQRRTIVHRAAYAAGVSGLAGALAAAMAIGGTGSPAQHANRIAAADLAHARLAAAVTASQSTSYKVKITASLDFGDRSLRVSLNAAYDPATVTGYVNSMVRPKNMAYGDVRLIDGTLYYYVPVTKEWIRAGSASNLPYPGDDLGLGISASVDPNQLFDTLRDKKATITQTGSNTYHFAVTRRDDFTNGHIYVTVTGDLTLNSDKRIAKVVYQTNVNDLFYAANTKKQLTFVRTEAVTADFSDYGTEVSVPTPPSTISK